MAAAPMSDNSEQPSENKNFSIEIEPSYPLIMAIAEFFREQKKPQQSLELCRRGLNYFPGDLGLRLGLARSYLDLTEKDKAWMELTSVVQELTKLAPIVESIAKFFQVNEQRKISEWFHQLYRVLSTSPEEGVENSAAPPVPSFFPGEEDPVPVDLKGVENSPREQLETKTYSQIANQDLSLFSAGKINSENKSPREGLPDSNILSTLTGWLSQMKESKA